MWLDPCPPFLLGPFFLGTFSSSSFCWSVGLLACVCLFLRSLSLSCSHAKGPLFFSLCLLPLSLSLFPSLSLFLSLALFSPSTCLYTHTHTQANVTLKKCIYLLFIHFARVWHPYTQTYTHTHISSSIRPPLFHDFKLKLIDHLLHTRQ